MYVSVPWTCTALLVVLVAGCLGSRSDVSNQASSGRSPTGGRQASPSDYAIEVGSPRPASLAGQGGSDVRGHAGPPSRGGEPPVDPIVAVRERFRRVYSDFRAVAKACGQELMPLGPGELVLSCVRDLLEVWPAVPSGFECYLEQLDRTIGCIDGACVETCSPAPQDMSCPGVAPDFSEAVGDCASGGEVRPP